MKLTLLIMMILSLFSLTACNTVQGIGKDVEKAGEAINKAAKK